MNISMKKSLLALVGAVGLMSASLAQADDPEWALYNGTSILTLSTIGEISCDLTIGGTISNDGEVIVKAVGVEPGSANCKLLREGNQGWTGTLSGGTLSTGIDSTIVYSGGSVIAACGGLINGITYGPTAPGTINTPASVNVSGAYGSTCAINGTLTLVADDV
jgi:hypothetical protein